jgi:AraC-like DNA-binding protein
VIEVPIMKTSKGSITFKTLLGDLLFSIYIDSNFLDNKDLEHSDKHNHPYFELHFITEGHGCFTACDALISVGKDDFILFGPKVYHSFRPAKGNMVKRGYIKIDFRKEKYVDDSFPQNEIININRIFNDTDVIKIPGSQKLSSLLEDCRCEIVRSPFLVYTAMQNSLASLIIQIVRSICTIRSGEYRPTRIGSQKSDRYTIIDEFFNNYERSCRIEELASLLALSTRQVERILKKKYDCTFNQKLIKTRVEAACDLLKNTDHGIEHIMETVGFSSTKQYIHAFKIHISMTPSIYRRSVL